jgi:tetratricopeptide (TPR) repeat protein
LAEAKDTSSAPPSPVATRSGAGFELRLERGGAYVRLVQQAISAGIRLEAMTLQIPDVKFPFDVGQGAGQFRHRLADLVELSVAIDVAAADEALSAAGIAAFGVEEPRIAARDGFVEIAGRLSGGPAFTLEAGLLPAGEQGVSLVFHSPRVLGLGPIPSAALPHLARSVLDAVGTDALPPEPLAPLLRRVLAPRGWKLPRTGDARLSRASVGEGVTRIAWDRAAAGPAATFADPDLLAADEGARTFRDAEALVACGDWAAAREAYLAAPGATGHPFAAERLLSLLAHEERFHEEALDLAAQWLSRKPGLPAALAAEASVRLARGEDERAARAFAALATGAATRGRSFLALAAAEAAYRLAGAAPEDALAAAEVALSVRRDHVPALRALRALARGAGDREALLRANRRLVAYDPEPASKARAHAELGELLLAADPPGARLHLDHALRLAPDDADALTSLARACAAAREPLRAVRVLDRLKDLLLARGERARAAAVALEAGALWEGPLEHAENALLRYRDAAELAPSADAHARAARAAEKAGQWAEAADQHAASLALLDPSAADAPALAVRIRSALADVAERLGDGAAAAAHLEKAAPLAPGDVSLLRRIAALQRALSRPAQLMAALDRLAPLEPDPAARAALLAEAAEAALALGLAGDARARFTAAAATHGACRPALAGLARLARERGDPVAEREALERLVPLSAPGAESADVLDRLADARERAGELAGALEAAAAARQASPSAARLETSLRLARRSGDPAAVAPLLAERARAAAKAGDAPLATDGWLERARLLDATNPTQALAALAEARALSPGNPAVLRAQAELAERTGDLRLALGGLRALLSGTPDDVAALELRAARAALGAGEISAARDHAERALARGVLGAAELLDEVLERVGDDGARAEILERRGRHVEAARLFERHGDGARARAALERAAADPATAAQALSRLAELRLRDGDRAGAAAALLAQARLARGREAARLALQAHAAARDPAALDLAIDEDPRFAPALARRAALRAASDPARALADAEGALSGEALPDDERVGLLALAARVAAAAGAGAAARRHLAAYCEAVPEDQDARARLDALDRAAGASRGVAPPPARAAEVRATPEPAADVRRMPEPAEVRRTPEPTVEVQPAPGPAPHVRPTPQPAAAPVREAPEPVPQVRATKEPAPPDPAPVRAALEEARRACERGEPAAAERLADAALQALAAGVEGAEEALREVLPLGPERDTARAVLEALVRTARERGDAAAEREALPLLVPLLRTGARPGALIRLSALALEAKDPVLARASAEAARVLAPRDLAAVEACRAAALAGGDMAAVAALLAEAALLDPASAAPRLLDRARLLAALRRSEEADDAFRDALAALPPDRALANEHARLRRAALPGRPASAPIEACALRMGDPREAAAALRSAAVVALSAGDLAAALRCARRAFARSQDDLAFAGPLLARVLYLLGGDAEALVLHRRLLEAGFPGIPSEDVVALCRQAAELAESAGERDVAIRALDELLRLRPQDTDAALIRFELDPDRTRAVRDLAEAAESSRSQRRRTLALARAAEGALRDAQDRELAERLFRLARREAAQSPALALDVACRRAEAIRAAEGASSPSFLGAMHDAAAAAQAAGDRAAARDLLEEVIARERERGLFGDAARDLLQLDALAAADGDFAESAARLRAAGALQREAGDLAGATETLRSAYAANPDSDETFQRLEDVLRARGAEAAPLHLELLADRAARARPGAERAAALVRLADAHRAAGDPDAAELALRAAVAEVPGHDGAEAGLLVLLADARRTGEHARLLLERSARAVDDSAGAMRREAAAALAASADPHDRDLAAEAWLAIAAASPADLDATRAAAGLLVGLGRWEDAIPHLTALVRADPDDDAAGAALSEAYQDRPLERAEVLLDRAARATGEPRATRLRQAAAALFAAGEEARASAALRDAFDAWPADGAAFAQALRDAGADPDRLDAILSTRARTVPEEAAACHRARGDTLQATGRMEEAIAAYEAALSAAPQDAELVAALAACLADARGDAAAAAIDARLLARADAAPGELPGAAEAPSRYRVGLALSFAGKPIEAVPHLERATSLAPFDAHAGLSWAALAEGHAARGDTASALAAARARVERATALGLDEEKRAALEAESELAAQLGVPSALGPSSVERGPAPEASPEPRSHTGEPSASGDGAPSPEPETAGRSAAEWIAHADALATAGAPAGDIRSALDRACEADPDSPEPWRARARIETVLGDSLAAARAYLSISIRADGDDAASAALRAACLFEDAGRHAEAARAYRAAVHARSGAVPDRVLLAANALAAGESEAAARLLTAVVPADLPPETRGVHARKLARALDSAGLAEEAARAWTEILAAAPGDPEALDRSAALSPGSPAPATAAGSSEKSDAEEPIAFELPSPPSAAAEEPFAFGPHDDSAAPEEPVAFEPPDHSAAPEEPVAFEPHDDSGAPEEPVAFEPHDDSGAPEEPIAFDAPRDDAEAGFEFEPPEETIAFGSESGDGAHDPVAVDAPAAAPAARNPQELARDGRARMEQRDFPGAYERLSLSLAADPSDLTVARDLSRVAEKLGLYDEYVQLGEVCADAIAAYDPLAAAARFRHFAEVLRDKVDAPERAAVMLEKALALVPDDPDTRRELIAVWSDAPETSPRALDAWMELARREPSDAAALSAVAALATRIAPASGAAAPRLLERGRLAASIAAFVSASDAPLARAALASQIPDELRTRVAAPGATGPLARLLHLLAPWLETLFPADLSRRGVGPGDRVVAGRAPAVSAAFEGAARALGARAFATFLSPRPGLEVSLENTKPPSVVLGAGVAGLDEDVLSFVAARTLDLLVHGWALVGRFAPKDVGILLELACRFSRGTPPSMGLPPERAGAFFAVLEGQVPPHIRAAAAELGAAASQELGETDARALAAALRRTANRVALLYAGDPGAALRALALLDRRVEAGALDPAHALALPDLRDLALFAMSDPFLELRTAVLG